METNDRIELWPLFGLRLTTPRLQLRLPNEEEAVRIAALVPDDLDVDPAWLPLPGVERPTATSVLRGYWRALGEWKVEHWRLPLAVWFEGQMVGFQELEGEQFNAVRTVDSSSWLVPSVRGLGIGKEMRAAVLAMAFDHLGAARAKSGAWEWNESSLGVSQALGYVDNGWDFESHCEKTGVMRRMILERSGWISERWPTKIEGVTPCLSWFGA